MTQDREDLRDVIERAVASEIVSRRFYGALAGELPEGELRQRARDLERDEAFHETMLIEAFPGIVNMERVLASLGGTPAPAVEKHGMTLASILTLAMNRERDSEEKYKAMAEEARDHEGYLLLLRLSEFERQHKVRLQRELEVLDPTLGAVGQYGRFL
jgi:rubrerythrin